MRKESRLIILYFRLNLEKQQLLQFFSLNDNKATFYKNIFQSLLEMAKWQILILWDVNGVFLPYMIKQFYLKEILTKSLKMSQPTCHCYFSWMPRYINSFQRAYIYYFSVHKTYSRVDMYCISNALLTNLWEGEMAIPFYAGHYPITVNLEELPDQKGKDLLQKYIQPWTIDLFPNHLSLWSLWDTLVRHFMSDLSLLYQTKRKPCKTQKDTLLNDLKLLESRHKLNLIQMVLDLQQFIW